MTQKMICIILCLALALAMVACSAPTSDDSTAADNTSASDTAVQGNDESGESDASSENDVSAETAPPATAGGAYKIGWAAKQITNDFDRDTLAYATATIEAAGGSVVTTDAEGDPTRHNENIESLLNSGIDGLIIETGDPTQVAPLIAKANEKHIPVITSNFASWVEGTLTNVNGDNQMLSALAANAMLASIGYAGDVYFISVPGEPIIDTRYNIFAAMAQDYPDVNVTVINTEHNAAKVQTQIEELLTANPEPGSIAGIYGSYDQLISSAVEAVRTAGRTEIKMGSIDGDLVAFQQLFQEDGPRVFTVAQNIPEIGTKAAQLMLEYLDGVKTADEIDHLTFVSGFLCVRANGVAAAEVRWGEEFWEKAGLDKAAVEDMFEQTLPCTLVSSVVPK